MPRTCRAGELLTGKPVSCYWTFYENVDEHVCYRQYICREHIGPLLEFIRRGIDHLDNHPSEFITHCMDCGDKLEVRTNYLWLKVFPPRGEYQRGEWGLCADCWLDATHSAKLNAERMPDRDVLYTQVDPWAGFTLVS